MLLEVKNLKKYFPVGHKKLLRAVDDVTLSIEKGETLGLVGESGCGKSTLGRTVIGLYEPTDGQILFEGKDVTHLKGKERKEFSKNIQMIFQDPYASLNPRMTVKEIISEGMVINGIKDKEYIDEKVYEILEMVGLVREHAGRYPHEFSGGQRQRIGIARAVIMRPDLLIADEPISALDVSIQAQVINLLNDLREKLGLTIMFIAHDLSVVKYFGKMVELADADELFAHPMHPYTRSLLSAIPLPDPHAEKSRVRISYNPLEAHDYSAQQPTLREIRPGHFVSCNDAEFEAYQKELA